MATFAWRRRLTRHFGEQCVPFVELGLRSRAGRWHGFSLEVDSGAVISVLRRSAADLLGVDYTAGEAIELASIGSPPQRYAIHRLEARIGDLPPFEMRIALAEREDVPNLLGRLDVFDHNQVDFDPSLEDTRFAPPWLDATDRKIWRHLLETEATILSKWQSHALAPKVDAAARRFVNRAGQLVAASAGLLKLGRDFELPLPLRSLFELSVQFEYLMRDPERRAALYLDYEHVTKYRSEQAWLRLPGPVGNHLRNSPRRGQGQALNKAEYDRVYSQYTIKSDTQRTRMHWYPGNLREIATQIGRLAEYDAVYGLFSSWAHGDPWTAQLPGIGRTQLWYLHALAYWARLLIQVADAKKIILAGDAYRSLVELAKGQTKQ